MPFSLFRPFFFRDAARPAAVAASSLVVLLAGCATPPPPAPPPAPAPVVCERPPADEAAAAPSGDTSAISKPGSPISRAQLEGNAGLLSYADRVRTMSIGELASEIARLNDVPDAIRGPYGDLQLAVALGQTRQPQDLQRAQGLLQRLTGNTTEDARRLQPLGRLIAARYAEQRRVEDLLDKQNQAMRDNQRKLDQLNERLEAVRAIERSLTRSTSNGAAAPVTPAARP